MSFRKCKPHIITYRNDKNYDNDAFRSEILTFCSFNEGPFMTKELHNATMKRSRYRNKFLKDKSETSRENYKIQRNLCKKLSRKTKKSYFESLNIKKITDNEPGKLLFLFSQIRRQDMKILSLMKQTNISDDKKICTIFINFFSNVSDLKIPD